MVPGELIVMIGCMVSGGLMVMIGVHGTGRVKSNDRGAWYWES